MDSVNDDYYYDSFENYEQTTHDPGPWILIGVTLYSMICLLILPVLVRRKEACRGVQMNVESGLNDTLNSAIESGVIEVVITPRREKQLLHFRSLFEKLVDISRLDNESRAILKLGIPLTLAAVTEAVFDAVSVALVSRNLGVDALSAYVITNLLIGLSDTFISGVGYALNTLCSHAIGCGNNKLAGQYTQIAMILYVVCAIPLLGMWWFVIDDCLRLFGVNKNVRKIGTNYTQVVVFHYLLAGVFRTFRSLLDVSGHASHATIMDISSHLFELAVLGVLLWTTDWMNLYYFGLIQALIKVFCTGGFLLFAFVRGWLKPYNEGLFTTFGLKNSAAVKNVVVTALPLGFGVLLEYAEWEALTVLAAVLGAAEVAAWAIMGSVWDAFESATGGLAEAGSIRVAYHLGRNDVEKAKNCSWKTLLISTILALVITTILFICGNSLSTWFTSDTTLQQMLNDLVPLIGIGNILMVYGMVSWSLVGAQGRYHLATIINTIMSICVTLPVGIIFSVVYRFTLEGLVGAVIIGYSSTGLSLGYLLLTTDWPKVAKMIQEENEASSSNGDDSSDDCSPPAESQLSHASLQFEEDEAISFDGPSLYEKDHHNTKSSEVEIEMVIGDRMNNLM